MNDTTNRPKETPYYLEVEDEGCKTCGAARTWTIVCPGNVGIGTSWEDQEHATELCEMLNDAYENGVQAGKEEQS